MRNIFQSAGKYIENVLLLFYPPLKHIIPPQLFLYATTGATNTLFDWILYFTSYNFILKKENLHTGFFTLSPHIAALAITFPITLISGFLLQKYVTFSASTLRGKTQISRYIMVVILNLAINILGLKILVEGCKLYPTPSKMIVTLLCITISYLLQKKFTFKI